MLVQSIAKTTVYGTADRITVTGGDTIDIAATYVGQASITTLGTITVGTWHGTSIATTYTDAKVKTVTGTANRISIGGTATDPTFDIDTAYVGQNTITTVGTIGTGTWNATAIADGKIASALTGKTYNAMTLTAVAVGFTIAGGTTSKTLTVPLDATVSGTNTGDQTTVSGNAGTATALQTSRNINGVAFNGTADITVPAAAGTLTGATLAAGVTASSLTSVGTLATLTVTATITGAVSGNAGTATALQNARTINTVSFNGTADIVVTAAAGTLTGATLNSGVTASSLTSVGTLTSLTSSGTITIATSATGGSQLALTNSTGSRDYTIAIGGSGGGAFPNGQITIRDTTSGVNRLTFSTSTMSSDSSSVSGTLIALTNSTGSVNYTFGIGGSGGGAFPNGSFNIRDTTAGANRLTIDSAGALTVPGAAILQGSLTLTGAFGCNAQSAKTAAASGGALAAYAAGANGLDTGAHMSSMHALVVAIRAALVANGIMS